MFLSLWFLSSSVTESDESDPNTWVSHSMNRIFESVIQRFTLLLFKESKSVNLLNVTKIHNITTKTY